MRRRDTQPPVAYLLGELEAEQAARFERALVADVELREEVERLRPVVARLEHLPGEAWDVVEPPPLSLPAPAGRPPRRLVLRPVVAAACALALAGVGVALGALVDRGEQAGAGGELALRPVGGLDPAAQGRVSIAGSDGLTVHVRGLRATASGQFYELWLLGRDQRLVGLGAFRVGGDGEATLRLPLPVDPASYEFFDLSLEPGDGDPGHSGLSVLRGPTRS